MNFLVFRWSFPVAGMQFASVALCLHCISLTDICQSLQRFHDNCRPHFQRFVQSIPKYFGQYAEQNQPKCPHRNLATPTARIYNNVGFCIAPHSKAKSIPLSPKYNPNTPPKHHSPRNQSPKPHPNTPPSPLIKVFEGVWGNFFPKSSPKSVPQKISSPKFPLTSGRICGTIGAD